MMMVTLGNDSLTAQRLGICAAKFKVESKTPRLAFRVHSAKLARLQKLLDQLIRRRRYLCAALAGFGLALAFPKFNLAGAAWVAPGLILACAYNRSGGKAWRIGYVAGPRDLVQALDTLLSQSAGNCCSISQAAAANALNGDQSFVADSVAIYKQRRDRMAQRINAIPGLSCAMPEGAFYLYINCAGLIGKRTPEGKVLASDGDVVMFLLEHAGVAVVAGTAYGLSPYFRLSIATAIDILMDGADRIAQAVADLTPG